MSSTACKEQANQTVFDFPIAALSTFHVDVTASAAQWGNHLGPVRHSWDTRAAVAPQRWKRRYYLHALTRARAQAHMLLHTVELANALQRLRACKSCKSIWYEQSAETPLK